ncbi:hypothetical protein NLI96_g13306 [Meripilus lineatus]|uniref:Uncharacterized protein n=1 Tax=Meripilus lineatus TaxID=2056292 RepID=A0AAD5Y6V6_9APHY|nr:hypothetical protein NLI96_g13306 [Physisporinus lineatus]
MNEAQRFIVQPELLLDAQIRIHDHDVGLFDEVMRDRAALGARQVECHAELVSVHAQEPQRLPIEERRPPTAYVVPAMTFLNLDDLGAKIR